MTEAELVQWRVAVGDHVTRDQIVVHVQTDKAEVELPVPASGTVVRLGAEVGDLVPVGAPLLELVPDDGTALGGTPVRGRATASTAGPSSPTSARRVQGAEHRARGTGPVQAAPPVRKLAKELGVDLATVTGTGPGGRVTAADVRASRPARPIATGASRCAASGGRWRATWPTRGARCRTSRCSTRSTPARCSTRTPTVRAQRRCRHHAHRVLRARRGRRARRRSRSSTRRSTPTRDELVLPRRVPHRCRGRERRRTRRARRARRARARRWSSSAAEIARVTEAGRAGHLTPETLRGATFTVTNFGTEGGRFATPIVRPPQVAILGFGAVRVRPVVDGDAVVAAPALPISLSADHRVVDGRDATGFLEAVAAQLATLRS